MIDGDVSAKDEVLKFLYTHKFTGRYENVTFVPYQSNEDFTPEDQIKLMTSNNAYQENLSRMIIKVKDARKKHLIDGETFSFQDWLVNTTIEKRKVIQGVEVAPDDIVRVLFYKEDIEMIREVIHNLYDYAVEVFGEQLTAHMIDVDELRRAKLSVDSAKAHSKKLKVLSGNPQGPDDQTTYSQPKQTKARCYYGTYLEVAQSNLTQASEITQDSIEHDGDLRQQVQAIAKAQQNMANSMNSTISSIVSSQIAPIEWQIATIQRTHKKQVDQYMELMKTSNQRWESIQQSLFNLGAPAQTPSEAYSSPPGVRR